MKVFQRMPKNIYIVFQNLNILGQIIINYNR
jgi:hypothetical protein